MRQWRQRRCKMGNKNHDNNKNQVPFTIYNERMHTQFRTTATRVVATVYFEPAWLMQTQNKAGCETTSSALGTGRARRWKERGRDLEMERSRPPVWKSAPSNSRKKPAVFADGAQSLFQGRQGKSGMWGPASDKPPKKYYLGMIKPGLAHTEHHQGLFPYTADCRESKHVSWFLVKYLKNTTIAGGPPSFVPY